MRINRRWDVMLFALVAACFVGCGGDGGSSESTQSETTVADSESESSGAGSRSDESGVEETSEKKFFKPVTLGGSDSPVGDPEISEVAGSEDSGPPPSPRDVMKALKPIATVLIGEWTGILKNASTNEAHNWIWDVKSDRNFPAIVLNVPKGEFFSEARLTYDPRKSQFLMKMTDAEGVAREFTGEFTEPVKDVPSDDGKTVERQFKLQLTELPSEEQTTRWQYLISQQNNNRYLMEVHRGRGKSALRLRDIIGTQRNGVSFAKADDDYGEQTCVISGGLGTSTVSHKGKTYYVCCSGCRAAFEEDPERWIAEFEAKKNEE